MPPQKKRKTWKKRPDEFWRQLDWSKTNAELSKRHRIGIGALHYRRALNAPPEHLSKRKRAGHHVVGGVTIDMQSVDWTKCNPELGEIYGVPQSRFRLLRAYLGKPLVKAASTEWHRNKIQSPARDSVRRIPLDAVTTIDWGRRDADIARELGVSREAVRQFRNRNGKQGLTRPWGSAADPMRWAKFRAAHPNAFVTVEEAVRLTGVSVAFAYAQAHIWKNRNKQVVPYAILDMGLPNSSLAEITGMKPVNIYRHRLALRKLGKAPQQYQKASEEFYAAEVRLAGVLDAFKRDREQALQYRSDQAETP
jgi:hypothetical protein